MKACCSVPTHVLQVVTAAAAMCCVLLDSNLWLQVEEIDGCNRRDRKVAAGLLHQHTQPAVWWRRHAVPCIWQARKGVSGPPTGNWCVLSWQC
jgi:hypothetical protein